MANSVSPRISLLSRVALLTSLLTTALASEAQTFCVYDPLGAQGDFFSMAKDYQLAARRWDVQIDLKPYTDDAQLDDAFKAGDCDMASMIGMHARSYNKFTGTIDAPSVIENYVQMRDLLNLMASPKVGKSMISGSYEVVGIIPVGAAYPVVNSRVINSFEKANGKKVGVMGWDKTQALMAEFFKVTPVAVPLPQYGEAFNKGKVDLIVAPMVLYKPMELYKGIGSQGGIVRRPLFSFTMQMVDHADKFPPGFGQKSREYMNAQVDHALGIIRNEEAQVDSRSWIYAVHSEVAEWNNGMRTLLDHLVNQGYFDRRMVSILQRIRCKSNPEDGDCSAVHDNGMASAGT